MSTRDTTRPTARWTVPAVSVAIGLGYLVAGIVGDNLSFGVFGLCLMVVVGGAFLLLGRRSEMVRGLADRRDERINAIDRDATLVAGGVVLAAVIVMFMVEVARGQDGSPYSALGALGGLTYVVALVWLRIRR